MSVRSTWLARQSSIARAATRNGSTRSLKHDVKNSGRARRSQ